MQRSPETAVVADGIATCRKSAWMNMKTDEGCKISTLNRSAVEIACDYYRAGQAACMECDQAVIIYALKPLFFVWPCFPSVLPVCLSAQIFTFTFRSCLAICHACALRGTSPHVSHLSTLFFFRCHCTLLPTGCPHIPFAPRADEALYAFPKYLAPSVIAVINLLLSSS